MKVLQIALNVWPNVGGLETHLADFARSLNKRGWKTLFLTYQPLTTKTKWQLYEKKDNITILRIPWIRGFFEKLVGRPLFEFLYLVPGLFIVAPLVILFFNPKVIHAHGLISAVPAIFWGKIFRKKVIVSLHSIYSFPKSGLYREFVKFLFNSSDSILCLSKKSYEEVVVLGVSKDKIKVFTYWIDLDRFKDVSTISKKSITKKTFSVLYVGRLVAEKGLRELLKALYLWDKNIKLVIVGTGPLEEEILKASKDLKNLRFAGKVNQEDLPGLYSSADLTIVPSVTEEGFGRVIIESLACSTPVLASNRGAIEEAMDNSVGKTIDITPENIKKWVEYYYKNPSELKKLSNHCRDFVFHRYSEKNAEQIIESYSKI